MLASTRAQYGPPEVITLKEVANPIPQAKEILVRVHASSISRTDCGILWGSPWAIRLFTGLIRPKLSITGSDFAGEVVAVGKQVSQFKIGDRVFGFDDNGLPAHAEFLSVKEDKAIAHIPEGISYEEAAASAEGAHYAYNYVRKIRSFGGHRVMVNGGTGAIGSAGIQFLAHFGHQITATARGKHLDLVRALGAQRVINYEQEDFTHDSELYDVVFDSVGKSSFGKCKSILKPKGIYMSSELGPRSENPFLALLSPLMPGKRVSFPVPVDIKGSLAFIRDRLSDGSFKPIMDRTYKLKNIQEAFSYVRQGQKVGNVVIVIPE